MLEESDLDLLTQELRPAQHKWKSIGYEVPYFASAEDIRHRYSDDGDRLREMLRDRLQDLDCTWRNIVDALRSPGVNQSQLADQLEAKYCPSEFTNNNILLYFSEYNAVQHYTCSLLCECIQCEVLRYLN